jgi:hypothetical protein
MPCYSLKLEKQNKGTTGRELEMLFIEGSKFKYITVKGSTQNHDHGYTVS